MNDIDHVTHAQIFLLPLKLSVNSEHDDPVLFVSLK